MKKSDAMNHWRNLPENIDPLPLMDVIPYKASGSRYGACGIRIDGNPEFIDAVLSNLKSLLAGEGVETRLGLSRSKVDGSGIGKSLPNAMGGAEVCYVRLCERGREGAMAAAMFGHA